MCLIKYHLFQDKVDTSYFTLHSIRNDMPKSLESTNKDILFLYWGKGRISYFCNMMSRSGGSSPKEIVDNCQGN